MAIVGAGLVGRSWAVIFARAGWSVKVSEPNPQARAKLAAQFREMAEDLATHGLAEDPEAIVANIAIADDLEAAVAGVEFVQENGPERPDVKIALFAELDRLAPRSAILASSSSAIVSSVFTKTLPGRDRCLIGHPVNPPHLVPIVEICGAPWTSPEAIARAWQVYADIGQTPVTIHKEIDGFVLNRLQAAVLAEALRLVADGVVSPQDLDHTMKDGLGLRWAFMGPFETIELNAPGGIADYMSRYGPTFQRIAGDPTRPDVWQEPSVKRLSDAWGQRSPEALKARMEWRDKTLAALVAHKRTDAPPPL